MVVSLIHPHDPYLARPEHWGLYNHDEIQMPMIPPSLDPHSERLRHGIQADVVQVTDDEIRNARHAYFANCSYFDENVGVVVKALEESGQIDNTIVIVTSDHGDMLGERGLWYKMNMFEHSARVPLLISGPGVVKGTSDSPCSLVDLLPTILDIGQKEKPEIVMPIDGRSLWPIAQGKVEKNGEAIAEYCAECASHPMFMIRRGHFKYIHCEVDPPQLYNIHDDPQELNNLIEDQKFKEMAESFEREVLSRWDSEAIRKNVIATQKQRRGIHAAMEAGISQSWDYNPPRDASNEFVRNHMDWLVAQETKRYPPHQRSNKK